MKHLIILSTSKKALSNCCSFLVKKSLAFCSCPIRTILGKTKVLTPPFCCCVASTLAHTKLHKPVNYQALDISKTWLFPVWVKWCFISSDWISYYSSTGMGNFLSHQVPTASLCSLGLLGTGRCKKVRSWKWESWALPPLKFCREVTTI